MTKYAIFYLNLQWQISQVYIFSFVWILTYYFSWYSLNALKVQSSHLKRSLDLICVVLEFPFVITLSFLSFFCHNPALLGHLMLLSQEEDKAPLLLPGLFHTNNLRFNDNFFIPKFSQLLWISHCKNMMNIFWPYYNTLI